MSGNLVNHGIATLAGLRELLFVNSPALSRAAGTVLLTAIWQGAVVATCLTICLKLSSRASAALRFAAWSGGFFAVCGLPFLPRLLRSFDASSTGAALADGGRAWIALDMRWSVALAFMWAAASLYRLADLAVHSLRLRKLWTSAKHIQSDAVHEMESEARLRLWGRRPVEICTTDALDRPGVIGFLAPRILIPEWLYERITADELRQIVLHETEHLRRGDDWTNLLQKLSLVVFPLNPVLFWIEHQLCLEREMACDEAVIRATGAPRAYAACLTSLAERGAQRRAVAMGALSLGAWQRRPELVRRVHSILRRRQVLGPVGTRGVLAAVTCGLVLGSVELSRCPQLVDFTSVRQTADVRLGAAAIPMDMTSQLTARMPDRIVDTRFVESPQMNPVHTSYRPSYPGKPYLEQLRATMSARAAVATESRFAYPGSYKPRFPKAATERAADQPTPPNLAHQTPRREMLKAQMAKAMTIPARNLEDRGDDQSYIVLTTWEEVSTPENDMAPSNSLTAQGDRAQRSLQGVLADPAKKSVQPSGEISVTRLVFRVVPATSNSVSPMAVPFRGGWLVIQL